jgi:hypothetical protein
MTSGLQYNARDGNGINNNDFLHLYWDTRLIPLEFFHKLSWKPL